MRGRFGRIGLPCARQQFFVAGQPIPGASQAQATAGIHAAGSRGRKQVSLRDKALAPVVVRTAPPVCQPAGLDGYADVEIQLQGGAGAGNRPRVAGQRDGQVQPIPGAHHNQNLVRNVIRSHFSVAIRPEKMV